MLLHLLPEPKELRLVKGMYPLDRDTLFLLPDTAGDQACLAAGLLAYDAGEYRIVWLTRPN